MQSSKTLISWTPNFDFNQDLKTCGQVAIGPHPDLTGWSDLYACSDGACWSHNQEMTTAAQIRYLFAKAMTLIVRDRMDPLEVHKKFCEIDEYRAGLAPDVPVPDHLKVIFQAELASDGR